MLKVAVISKTNETWLKGEGIEADIAFEKIKLALINLCREETVWLISPLNRGIETMAAEIAVMLGGNIKLECALPFEEQAKDWSESERDKYFSIIERCETETMITSQKGEKSEKYCYTYLVNKANLIILGEAPNEEIAELIKNSGKKVIEI